MPSDLADFKEHVFDSKTRARHAERRPTFKGRGRPRPARSGHGKAVLPSPSVTVTKSRPAYLLRTMRAARGPVVPVVKLAKLRIAAIACEHWRTAA